MIVDDSQLDLADLILRTASGVIARRIEGQQSRKRVKRFTNQAEWSRAYLPAYFKVAPSAMHRWSFEQCDRIKGERGSKVNLIGPRGGAKSTIWSLAYALRAGLEGWESLIWLVSDTAEQAEANLENIRIELTENTALGAAFPDSWGRGRVWRRNKIRLRNGVTIEAFGKGKKIRGRRAGANRPSLIISDDLQGDNVMTSAHERDKDWRWFNGALLNAGNAQTNIVNLATALHPEAVALKLHRTAGWRSRLFQAIPRMPNRMQLWEQWQEIYQDSQTETAEQDAEKFFRAHMGEMLEGAELLWPEMEDLLTLMKLRVERGRREFEREKQGRPVSSEDCEWPESYFDDGLVGFDEWPEIYDLRVMALDPSKGKDARRGDYSAFAMVQITGGTVYCELDLERRPVPQIVSDGVELYRRFQPNAFGIEANQFQELLGGLFFEEFRRRNILGVEPYMLTNTVNKLVRIRTLGPLLEKRRIRFKRRSPGTLLALSQLRDFPDKDSHDDGPDALEMAVRLASQMFEQIHDPGDGLGNSLIGGTA